MRWILRGLVALFSSAVLFVLGLAAMSIAYSGDFPVAAVEHRQKAFKALAIGDAASPSDRIVVLMVFDGLAPDLVRAVATPSLERMKREGAHTLGLIPVFPTLSMPNHTALSTGCYPEHHGVVSNRFIDPKRGLYAGHLGDAIWLEGCEHITEVAERQGVRVSNLGWVGANRGPQLLASEGGPYEEEGKEIDARVEQVLHALAAAKDTRARLIVSYVDEPDHTLHFDGVTAASSREMMKHVDAAIGRVMDAIEKSGLRERTTLLVTSDHGMVAAGDHINVERVLRNAGFEGTFAADATLAHVYLTDPSTKRAVIDKLAKFPHLDVIDPEQANDLHLGHSKRLGDIVLAAKAPYYMFDRGIWPEHLRFGALLSPELLSDHRLLGMHGYPPSNPGVRAVFFALGAGIAPGAKLDGMRSIDVHPSIARLLSIESGAPVDGAAYPALYAPAAAQAEPPTAAAIAPAAQ